MVESSFLYNLCFNILPWILFGLLGLGLGWLLFRGRKQDGDLSIEGEGALRAEILKVAFLRAMVKSQI